MQQAPPIQMAATKAETDQGSRPAGSVNVFCCARLGLPVAVAPRSFATDTRAICRDSRCAGAFEVFSCDSTLPPDGTKVKANGTPVVRSGGAKSLSSTTIQST